MSKAEDRALEAYPVVMTTLIPADKEHPLIEQDCNQFKREAYIEGYHQAEKDLELGWEDIKTIDKLLNQCVDYSNPYQEVLKRFNVI